MEEIWEKVLMPNFSAKVNLWVSNYGRIKSFRTKRIGGKILKGTTISNYRVVFAESVEGKRITLYIHKLVAVCFLDHPTAEQKYVIHKDFDLQNNYYLNLAWASVEEVKQHNLLNPRRQNIQYNVKLTLEQVQYIRKRVFRLKREGGDLYVPLARKFNVSVTQIKRIVDKENWK